MINPHPIRDVSSKFFYQSDFVEEVNNLVTFLNRVMGLLTSSIFEEWMWYFIEEILREDTKFHWDKMISDNIHN